MEARVRVRVRVRVRLRVRVREKSTKAEFMKGSYIQETGANSH